MFNSYNGFGNPNQPVFNGVQPNQTPKRTQALTDEELALLSSERKQFNLALTKEEEAKANCNHVGPDGRDTLEYDPMDPNVCVCKICGQKFTPILSDTPVDYVRDVAQQYVNVLQTIKLMFVDMPVEVSRAFFAPTIGLAQKTPELFELAAKNLAKYDNYNPYGYQGASQSAMSLLGNFMSNIGQGGFGFQGQPVYQQQPMMQQQPMGYGNAFGFPGASQFQQQPMMNGYVPGTQGFQYTPQAAPTAAPAAEAPATETTTTQNVQA